MTRTKNDRNNVETHKIKLLSNYRHLYSSLISQITGKNEYKVMLNIFESELLDHQHHNFVKRPLIEKKVINYFLKYLKLFYLRSKDKHRLYGER